MMLGGSNTSSAFGYLVRRTESLQVAAAEDHQACILVDHVAERVREARLRVPVLAIDHAFEPGGGDRRLDVVTVGRCLELGVSRPRSGSPPSIRGSRRGRLRAASRCRTGRRRRTGTPVLFPPWRCSSRRRGGASGSHPRACARTGRFVGALQRRIAIGGADVGAVGTGPEHVGVATFAFGVVAMLRESSHQKLRSLCGASASHQPSPQ